MSSKMAEAAGGGGDEMWGGGKQTEVVCTLMNVSKP